MSNQKVHNQRCSRTNACIFIVPALLFSLVQVSAAIEPYKAREIEVYQSKPILPYQAETIKPNQGNTIAPYEAQTIAPDQPKQVVPDRSRTISPDPAKPVRMIKPQTAPIEQQKTVSPIVPQQKTAAPAAPPAPPEYAFHAFRLRIPGAVYTTPSYNPNYDILHTSSGYQTESVIQVNRDGSYIWNSKWDGRIIRGKWSANSDGTITVLNGQENRSWTLGRSGKGTWGGGDIYMNGSTWYNGDIIK